MNPDRIRAAIRTLYPDEMTPTAKRVLERVLDQEGNEAPASAGAFAFNEGAMREPAKFQAWQSVDCAWCDSKATGNALYIYDGQWCASCGKHGRKYEPFEVAS